MRIIWLIIFFILLVCYKIYYGSPLLSFSLGSFVTFFLSFICPNGLFQLLIFLLISLLTLTFLSSKYAPTFLKYSPPVYHPENLVGKQAIVVKAIGTSPLDSGLIKLDNELWHASSTTLKPIAEGTLVTVISLRGICAKVTP